MYDANLGVDLSFYHQFMYMYMYHLSELPHQQPLIFFLFTFLFFATKSEILTFYNNFGLVWKCICTQNYFGGDMGKGHTLEAHCTNIPSKRFKW